MLVVRPSGGGLWRFARGVLHFGRDPLCKDIGEISRG